MLAVNNYEAAIDFFSELLQDRYHLCVNDDKSLQVLSRLCARYGAEFPNTGSKVLKQLLLGSSMVGRYC